MELSKNTTELSRFIVKHHYKSRFVRKKKLRRHIKKKLNKTLKNILNNFHRIDFDLGNYEEICGKYGMNILYLINSGKSCQTCFDRHVMNELYVNLNFAYILYLKVMNRYSLELDAFIDDARDIMLNYLNIEIHNLIYAQEPEESWNNYLKSLK